MRCRRGTACAAVAIAALALGACGGSARSDTRHDTPPTHAPTTPARATVTTTTADASAAQSTTAPARRVTPNVAAALEQQLSAMTGELSVANSAIAQADVDAAKAQEGTEP